MRRVHSGIYPALDSAILRRRIAAFDRFDDWRAQHPVTLSPAEAIAAVGALFAWLPPASRAREIDARGVIELHRLLSVWSTRPR